MHRRSSTGSKAAGARSGAVGLRVCVGALPPCGAALGLGLDLVVQLSGRRLLLLLVPPLRPRGSHPLGSPPGAPQFRVLQLQHGSTAGAHPAADFVDFLRAHGLGRATVRLCCPHSTQSALPVLVAHRGKHFRGMCRELAAFQKTCMVIRDMGPLEWIFNTPKHHRVHHGRNLYCIDKNFGGILIIWDRLFGTFSPEKDKVVYGLVYPSNSFEIITSQFHYYLSLWRRSTTYSSLADKVSTFVKGPSWTPGNPRLGNYNHVPKLTGEEKPHDPSCSLPVQVYVVTHFLLVLHTYHELFENQATLTQLTILGMTGYILLTLTSLGFIIDCRPLASILEMLRCMCMVMLLHYSHLRPPNSALTVPTQALVSFSVLYWALQSFSQLLSLKMKSH